MKVSKSILFVVVMLALIMSACGPAEQAAEVETYTVGVVNYAPLFDPLIDGFKARMTELGYIEGVNITYIYERASGLDAVEGLVTFYIEQNVDLILTTSTPASQITAQLTADSGIPVVFGGVTDAVSSGIVASMENPGANVTGVMVGLGVHTGRVDMFLEMVPDAKRLYAPLNAENSAVVVAADATRAYAETVGVQMVEPVISTEEDTLTAINSIPSNADALFVYPDTLLTAYPDELVQATLAAGVPLISQEPALVESGALFCISNDWTQTGRDAAEKADLALKGTKPADIPVGFDQTFLTINLQSAEALGMTIPADVLAQADTIIR
ncbi:MAG: ABC transporter substrate-binding protein [Anaerolineales bacterium]|nr:ABC transporter substrate-binding protein [Anaerolineales bacterium]